MSRRVNKERTRNRLLQAVLKIIHRNGLGALTTGKAAQLAGVAQPTFYVHFKSMDEALEQVGSLVSEQLRAAFRSTPEANPDRAAEAVAGATGRAATRGPAAAVSTNRCQSHSVGIPRHH